MKSFNKKEKKNQNKVKHKHTPPKLQTNRKQNTLGPFQIIETNQIEMIVRKCDVNENKSNHLSLLQSKF